MISTTSPFTIRSSPHFLGARIAHTSPHLLVSVGSKQPRVSAAYTSTERPPSYASPNKMASTASFYEVLGLPTGATCQEIKTAYRKLARVCHPDVVAIDRKDTSADKFIKIHAAYSTLSDPEKRADYDRKLIQQQQPFRSPVSMSASSAPGFSSFTGFGRRTWETDQCW